MKFKDRQWRLNHLYKIVDKSGNLITFKENPQQAIVNSDPSHGKIILKARQIGFSTGCLIELFDRTIWNRNQTSVIIAHEQDSIKKLFRIIYRAYKYMDPSIKPAIDRGGGSQYEYFFPEINSRIYCDLESRSDTIQNLHVSEIGLMKNDDRVRATLDAVPINGRVTYESTPKGFNHFQEMWADASRSEKKFFFPWYCFPEYQLSLNEKLKYTEEEIELIRKALLMFKINISPNQIAFRRWKITQKGGGTRGRRAFTEEFPEDDISCFLSSGESVFDLVELRKRISEAEEPIKDDGYLKIYLPYDKTKSYVVGADVAEGVNKDFSVAVMIEAETKRVAAVLRGQFKPYEFAHRINAMCEKYRREESYWPLVSVERNNHGHAVLLELNEHIGYPSLYVHSDDKLGWRTDSVTRPIMINAFIDAVENNLLKIPDRSILGECLTLVNNNGKIEATDGKHDDCVVASAIAFQMVEQMKQLDVYKDLHKKILM